MKSLRNDATDLSAFGQFDCHSHFLPGIDDGAADVEVSVKMLTMLRDQGIKFVAATPHFYLNNENVESFVKRRGNAIALLNERLGSETMPHILPGAEVSISPDISDIDLRCLCIGDTRHILLELPFTPLKKWMLEEIQNITYAYGLLPILAHVERYLPWYSDYDYAELLSLDDCTPQINTTAFLSKNSAAFVKRLVHKRKVFFIGSDCHNLNDRAPNFNVVTEQIGRIAGKSKSAFAVL